jgi:NADH:ubiquinone oxidoreductase subunit K
MIRSSNLIFCQAAYYYTDVDVTAHALVPIVLAVAACEAAVGLGLLVVVYRARGTVDFKSINSLKG